MHCAIWLSRHVASPPRTENFRFLGKGLSPQPDMMVKLPHHAGASIHRDGKPMEGADLQKGSPKIPFAASRDYSEDHFQRLQFIQSQRDSVYSSHCLDSDHSMSNPQLELIDSERGIESEEGKLDHELQQLLLKHMQENNIAVQTRAQNDLDKESVDSGTEPGRDLETVSIDLPSETDNGQKTLSNLMPTLERSALIWREEEPQHRVSGSDQQSRLLKPGHRASPKSSPGAEKSWKRSFLHPKGLFSVLWFRALPLVTAVLFLVVLILSALLGIALSAEVQPPSRLEPCPMGWLYNGRKCYYLSDSGADWGESQRFCSSHNASLALIDSQEELTFLMGLSCNKNTWIGLRQIGDKYQWANGTVYNGTLFSKTDYGECVYIQENMVLVSGCSLRRKYMCNKEPYL